MLRSSNRILSLQRGAPRQYARIRPSTSGSICTRATVNPTRVCPTQNHRCLGTSSKKKDKSAKAAARAIMEEFDTNKDGVLQPEELERMLSKKNSEQKEWEKELAKFEEKFDNLSKPYKVTSGKNFDLSKCSPADTQGLDNERAAKEFLEIGTRQLARYQDTLYANGKWSILLVFQAMDAAGKDGTIKHVFGAVNPQGCKVSAFKKPSPRQLDHDFLWRCSRQLPPRGHIGIFNRSYYEDVLVSKVHPELIRSSGIPERLLTNDLYEERYESIRDFEKHLTRNGTVIRKFFLNVSKAEQKSRFLARLTEPSKNWKFSEGDARERGYWDEYQRAYNSMIKATSTKEAPWYVIPADKKWFTRLVVANVVSDTLKSLKLSYPDVSNKQDELNAARKALMEEPN